MGLLSEGLHLNPKAQPQQNIAPITILGAR